MVKIFHFSDEWKVVSVAPQREGVTPRGVYTPHKSRGVFSDILATAIRLNTLYGLETLYVQSPRRVLITKKVLRHIRSIYDVINVGFFQMSKVSFVALTFANVGVRKN